MKSKSSDELLDRVREVLTDAEPKILRIILAESMNAWCDKMQVCATVNERRAVAHLLGLELER